MSEEGETPKVEQKMECPGDGTGRMFKHSWIAVWETVDGQRVPTNRSQCQTCGQFKTQGKP